MLVSVPEIGSPAKVETLRTRSAGASRGGGAVGFERSAYVTDLRTLQTEVAELKADVVELKHASGE